MIKYKILLIWYSYFIEHIVYMFGSHEQFWKHYHKVNTLKKMQKLTPLEKELI